MSGQVTSAQAEAPRAAAPAPKRSRKRRVMRALLWTAAALCVLVLLALGFGLWKVWRAWPQATGTATARGLRAPAEVIRDRWGVPHIYAQDAHDLFFAQGYAQAQDRAWQLEFSRRLGSGRLAEALGADASRLDRYMRVLGLRRTAEGDWEKMKGEDRAALEAYAAGVNAHLENSRGRLPVEFSLFGIEPEPWTPIDSLVVVKLMSWVLSENATIQISRSRIIARAEEEVARQLLPAYSETGPVIVPREEAGAAWMGREFMDDMKSVARTVGTAGPTKGSNSWAVAGGRTNTGKPILANDTHLDLFMPSVWYANGLHGGGYDAVGYSLAGTPGVSIGHNRRVAWGITDLVADVQDFFVEKLDDAENPTRYEHRGEWRPLAFRDEEIKIKGAEPMRVRVAHTEHGPLVNNWIRRFKDERPLALAWAAGESATLIQSILLLNRANDWDEFRRALGLWDGPNINFVYADVDGNIGYQAAGRIPVRSPSDQGIVPSPGWTGEHDWQGFIPPDRLPRTLNPASGFVVTANQKPVGDDFPYQLGYEFADPFRAIRLNQLLAENSRMSVEDAGQMMGDTYHLPAESLRPYMLAVEPADDLEARALEVFRAWNLRCDPEEAGASVYQVWYRFLVEETVRDELGPELTTEYMEYYWIHGPVMLRLMAEGTSRLFDDTSTPRAETRDDIVRRSLGKAVAWLAERYGRDPAGWKWGQLHTLSFRHRPVGMAGIPVVSNLFNYGPIAAPGGDRFTVNATWFTWDDPERPYAAEAGTSQRIVMDLADWDRSVAVNSTGQSEMLFHEHRNDQIPLWQELKFHPLLFTREAVESGPIKVLKIVPAAQ
ncbi:MAG TPA: penicillin acylase family protein [Pyrinomonadaceae bacterium]|nr:penicillin acylase family protein [Pyrinomonadaceae bacterium]